MINTTLSTNIKSLFLIPSFYGAITWGTWLVLYVANLIKLDDCNIASMTIYLLVEAMFILSALVVLPYYKHLMQENESTGIGATQPLTARRFGNWTILLILHAIGFLGLIKYVADISRNLGGIAGFLFALGNEAYAIRWESETTISIGTQLTYFGWIAIAFTVYQFQRNRITGYWLILAFLQLIGNFLYIDRTRPFWILFTSIIMILPASRKLPLARLIKLVIGSVAIAVIVFWAVAEWTGKTAYEGKFENSVLPGITQEIYVYGVSGFAYFNKMLEGNEQISYDPERFFYPLFKYLAKVELVREPPSQVIDFYDVPFSTNVGTFLEPFYRDGGLLFVLCGIIIYSFGIDLIGYFFLKQNTPIAIFVWANLCFTSFIGFVVPKFSSFPIWLFGIIGVVSIIFPSLCRLVKQPRQPESGPTSL